MPEGVECLKQTDYVCSLFVEGERNYRLTKLKLIGKRLVIREKSIQALLDKNLEAVFCKGKYFFILFETGGIIAHHGMSGCWSTEVLPNSHAKLTLKGPNDHKVKLYWVNERFGQFSVVEEHDKIFQFYDSLADGFIGLDILEEDVWMAKVSKFGKKKKIRDTFFDQHQLCSGIGNYLIAEIFHKARLHPNALFSNLSEEEVRELYHICKETVEGHYLGTLTKVIYKKEKDPDGRTIRSEQIGSRTMHWVPEIQTRGI